MGRLRRWVDRAEALVDPAERVLELAARWLAEHVPARLDPQVFEATLAFRFDARRGSGRLVPIPDPALFDLDDLLGVGTPLERLILNTEQFLEGLPSNHVLLFGERGTGKSSAVRGLLARYAARALTLPLTKRISIL